VTTFDSSKPGGEEEAPPTTGSTRRQFLTRSALLGLAVGAAPLLAACGGDDEEAAAPPAEPTAPPAEPPPAETGGGETGAPAQSFSGNIVVATMPGPRWEGALRSTAEAYMNANPDVEVEIVVSPFTEHYQRIATSLATDSSEFDVFVFDAALMGQSYAKLQPLNELFDSNPEWSDYYLNGVPPEYRGSWDWEGVPYSVVHDANAMMAWWRTDIFEQEGLQEPTTFDIMLENAKALEELKEGSGFMTTAAADAHLAVLVTGMMHAFGGKWWENDTPDRFGRVSAEEPPGEVLLDSPEMIAAMTMLRDLHQNGNPASLNAREFENNEAVVNEQVYQQLMWSGLMVLQSPELNPELHDKLLSRDFPLGGSNTDTNSTGMKGGFGLAIPAASQQIEAAFDYCRFSTSAEGAEAFIAGGGQPANATLLNEYSSQPGFQVFATIAEGIIHGHHQAQFPEGGEFYTVLFTNGGAILAGDVTPEEGCAKMKSDTEALLERAGYI
jgi:ABC-type glycerol-3-phosphate transport system substrate-binding protein